MLNAQTPLDVLPSMALILIAAFMLAMVAVGVMILGHVLLDVLDVGTIRGLDVDLVMLRTAANCFALGVGCLLVLLGWGAVEMIQAAT